MVVKTFKIVETDKDGSTREFDFTASSVTKGFSENVVFFFKKGLVRAAIKAREMAASLEADGRLDEATILEVLAGVLDGMIVTEKVF